MSTDPSQVDWLAASTAIAKQRRDRGIKRAVEHAERVVDAWQERTYALLVKFVEQRAGAPFLAEDFRQWGRYTIPTPPDPRAFGGIFARARKSGLIVSIGVGKANSSNRSLKVMWQQAPTS